MNSEEICRRIAIRQIDTSEVTFRITTRLDSADIQPSIARLGLLHPPILQPLPDGYRVISGYRRIRACRNLGLDPLPATVLPQGIDELHCARLAIADNALQRPLNLIEQSRALTLLAGWLPEHREMRQEASTLGLPSNPDLIDKLQRLGRLDQPIQSAVLAGRLSLAMALELGQYPQGIAARLTRLFEVLRMGLNRQREMLTLLREIAARENRSMGNMLADASIQACLDDDFEGSPAAAGRLLERLRRRRFPRVTAKIESLEKNVSALQPGQGVRLTPPSDLEAFVWRLDVSFQTADELQRQLKQARKLSENPRFKKIMEED